MFNIFTNFVHEQTNMSFRILQHFGFWIFETLECSTCITIILVCNPTFYFLHDIKYKYIKNSY